MTAASEQPPAGRYGRYGSRDEARHDRILKIVGGVLGAGMLALVGWLGYVYIAGQDVTAELIRYKVVSDEEVQVHLEVRKDPDTTGVCTLRSRGEDGGEVGRADFVFDARADRVDKVVTLRTVARATNAELVGCQAAQRD